jgi:hypothetical protein
LLFGVFVCVANLFIITNDYVAPLNPTQQKSRKKFYAKKQKNLEIGAEPTANASVNYSPPSLTLRGGSLQV